MKNFSNLTKLIFALLGCLAFTSSAYAHRPNDSRLMLDITKPEIQGELWLQINDLEWVLGLDQNQDKKISWREFKEQLPMIEAQFPLSILIDKSNENCFLKANLTDINSIAERSYARFSVQASCPSSAAPIHLKIGYLQQVDPQHQLFLSVKQGKDSRSLLLTPSQPEVTLTDSVRVALTIQSFIQEGIRHIFTGYDHILFILTLLFSALIAVPAKQQKYRIKSLLWMISSFTVAHSITLIGSALNWFSLPSQWVESAIAATVIVSALNVFLRWANEKLWIVTFSFGLIHGMGFASALRELAIPEQNFVTSLLSFNVGVEIGQMILLAGSLPVLFCLAHIAFPFQQRAIRTGAGLITMMGFLWLIERVANIDLLSNI